MTSNLTMFGSIIKSARVFSKANVGSFSRSLRQSSLNAHKSRSFSTTKEQGLQISKGSNEAADLKTISVLNGVPESYLKERVATIEKNVRPSTQHGMSTSGWTITFDQEQVYWASPLMEWTGTADSLHSLEISFATKEQAIKFAEENGINFTVNQDSEAPVTQQVKSYSDNFKFKGSGEDDPLLKRDF